MRRKVWGCGLWLVACVQDRLNRSTVDSPHFTSHIPHVPARAIMSPMKRWGLVWVVSILSCVPILLLRATGKGLLEDSDTAFLLKIIRERQDPMYWFTHDWPLMNHFYRPISTLPFELDNALYGNQAWGYGLTNALICCLCIFLLAWLMRELTDSIPLTVATTALFGLWHWNWLGSALPWIGHLVWVIGFLGIFRHGFKVRFWLPAVAAFAYLMSEMNGIVPLYYRMVGWIPGRTASVMTIFCLISMAAYARYERTSAKREDAKPTSMDEPAGTRSTVLTEATSKAPWLWALVALVAAVLAFGAYEQAVMLPTALLGVAVSLRLQRYRVRWSWQIGFWSLIILYYLVRKAFLPEGTSGYQLQQFRDGPGVFFSITAYILPCLSSLYMQSKMLDLGFALLTTGPIYSAIWETIGNAMGFVAARRHWVLALTGLALSFLTYLPMAWLNQFDHYHYWPMALRSLFVVVLAWGTWELIVIAISPPARKAPPRPAPAPGSLPHR